MFAFMLKWGTMSGAFICVVSTIGYAIFPLDRPMTFALAESTSYFAVFSGTLFLLLAFQDAEFQSGTHLNLAAAIVFGIGIVLTAGLIFGLYSVAYLHVLVPNFLEAYHKLKLDHMALPPGREFEIAKAQIESELRFLKMPRNTFVAFAGRVWSLGLFLAVAFPLARRLLRGRNY